MQVAGGSNGLYLADILKRRKRAHTILVEGELDALSIFQTCRDLVHVVATGTTQGGHLPRWLSLLAQQEKVFVAFDAEDKGDIAAKWWLSRLPNARRLRPWWHDANQMLQDGANLRDWICTGIEETRRYHGPVENAPPGAVNCTSTGVETQQFLTTVARIVALLPKGCTMTVDPPEYTMEQRVQELQAEMRAKERARYEAMMQSLRGKRASKAEK